LHIHTQEGWQNLKLAKIFILFAGFAGILHWVACGWALINLSSDEWIEAQGFDQLQMPPAGGADHSDSVPIPTEMLYVHCLYSAAMILIGDNISPINIPGYM